MKPYLYLLLLIMFPIVSLSSEEACDRVHVIGTILKNTSSQLEKQYGLHAIGTGGSVNQDNKSTMIGIDFRIYQPLTRDEARKLILASAELLLKNLNQEEKIKNCVCELPFPYKNIQIAIYISYPDKTKPFDPEIATVSFAKGIVSYKTLDPDIRAYKSRIEETYEEALQKLSIPGNRQ